MTVYYESFRGVSKRSYYKNAAVTAINMNMGASKMGDFGVKNRSQCQSKMAVFELKTRSKWQGHPGTLESSWKLFNASNHIYINRKT